MDSPSVISNNLDDDFKMISHVYSLKPNIPLAFIMLFSSLNPSLAQARKSGSKVSRLQDLPLPPLEPVHVNAKHTLKSDNIITQSPRLPALLELVMRH